LLLSRPFTMSTPYELPSPISKIKSFEWDDKYDFPRDLVGYGENLFNPQWPGGAKNAVSFVIKYEEAQFTLLESCPYVSITSEQGLELGDYHWEAPGGNPNPKNELTASSSTMTKVLDM
jgi:hypothetical protein